MRVYAGFAICAVLGMIGVPLMAVADDLDLMGVEVRNEPVFQSGNASADEMSKVKYTKTRITRIIGPDGKSRKANLTIFSSNGQPYADEQNFEKIFQGVSVRRDGQKICIRRSDGSCLYLVVKYLKLYVLMYDGSAVDTGLTVCTIDNADYLPVNGIGQFFGAGYSQDTSGLKYGKAELSTELSSKWQKALNNVFIDSSGTAASSYYDQISKKYPGTPEMSGGYGNDSSGKVFHNITATVFSSVESGLGGAYGEWLRPTDMFVALPYRFKGRRPWVAVQGPKGIAVAEVKDVGPWNINDPYWMYGARPQAERGRDKRGRRTNLAGIDLSPALAKKIGIKGKGKVDWWFARPQS